MPISSLSSKSINFCRTVLCMQVVFYHMATTAPVPQENLAHGTIYGSIILFITMLNNIAVPMFFTISGYLLAVKFEPTWQGYVKTMRKKLIRLGQPLIIWTSVFLILYYIAQQLPATAPLFSGENELIRHYNLVDYIDAYIGFRSGFTFVGQYWFLRNLLILCLFSPLIIRFYRRTRFTGFLLTLAMCITLRFMNLYIADSIFFFSIGIYIAVDEKPIALVVNKFRLAILLFAIFTILCFIGFVVPSMAWLYSSLFYFYVLTGFIVIAHAVHRMLSKNFGNKVLLLAGGSYFIFLIHQQILMFLKRVVYKTLPIDSAFEVLVAYFAVPTIIITLLYLLYFLLKKYIPRLLNVLTGKTGILSFTSKKKAV